MVGMRRALVVLALLVAACRPSVAGVPWNDGLPEGGVVIYHADYGEGVCSGYGCPTRIVAVAGVCITETYHGSGWTFRESEPCAKS